MLQSASGGASNNSVHIEMEKDKEMHGKKWIVQVCLDSDIKNSALKVLKQKLYVTCYLEYHDSLSKPLKPTWWLNSSSCNCSA